MSYYTKITKTGLAAITAAINNNSKVPITYMAFGDGNGSVPEPNENSTSLVNEVYRTGVNKVELHTKNPNWLVCEAIIPSAVGGFNIREIALYDKTGSKMLAVASYPPTYKPTVEEGAAKIQTIRIVLQVNNTGNVELIIDPDIILATKQDLNKGYEELKDNYIENVNSVSDLLKIQPIHGQTVETKGFHEADNFLLAQPYSGGAKYTFNASLPHSHHNGGTVIALGSELPTDWTDRESVVEWFLPKTAVGLGAWVLVYSGQIDVTWFGAKPNFTLGVDNSLAFNRALMIKNEIFVPAGNYIIHRPILTNKAHTSIRGGGIFITTITVENTHWESQIFNEKEYNSAIVVTSGVQDSWITGGTFSGFSLLGNSYEADGKHGFFFDNVCTKVSLNTIEIVAFDKGIYTYKSWLHSYHNVTITDCRTHSIHMDSFANGYSITGCCLYGKETVTLKHLVVENACYGNSFTGGAIEKCNVGVSVRNNAQININGTDFEEIGVLAFESIDCEKLPSKVENSSVMGNPSQSMFATNNGYLIIENNKIFNPHRQSNHTGVNPLFGDIETYVYFTNGEGGIVANNNVIDNPIRLIGGNGKVTGSDVGRLSFNKSVRSSNPNELDTYTESNQNYFYLFTNNNEAYRAVDGHINKTQIGNMHFVEINTTLEKLNLLDGDYFTFQIPEIAGKKGVFGKFIFSKSNDLFNSDPIYGNIVCDNGTCYLSKTTGALLKKSELNPTENLNFFSLNMQFCDNI